MGLSYDSLPDWTKDEHWSPQQLAFIEWLLTPKDFRQIKYQRDLSDALQVSESTLTAWKRSPEFQEKLRYNALQELADHRADVYQALKKKAKDGSYVHIKLFVELIGDHIERIDITSGGDAIGGSDVRFMTTDELARKFAEDRAKAPQMQAMGVSADHLEAIIRDMMNKGVVGLTKDTGVSLAEETVESGEDA